LKAGLWFRRARLVILAPDPRHPRRAQAENPLNDLSKFSRPPLSKRGEQLTLAVIREHAPQLLPPDWKDDSILVQTSRTTAAVTQP